MAIQIKKYWEGSQWRNIQTSFPFEYLVADGIITEFLKGSKLVKDKNGKVELDELSNPITSLNHSSNYDLSKAYMIGETTVRDNRLKDKHRELISHFEFICSEVERKSTNRLKS